MKAILSVVGKDKVGIIAAVCNKLAKYNVNVLEISQTILAGNFTMLMIVDAGACTIEFKQLAEELSLLGTEIGVEIHIQREEIVSAMHTI